MKHSRIFQRMKTAIHLKKCITNLPRSVIYIPGGYFKGLHICLPEETVGIGSWNKVKKTYHVEKNKTAIARSGLAKHVSVREISVNNEYAKLDPEGNYFITGYPVWHKGSWRPRGPLMEEADPVFKQSIPQLKNASKITMIMPEMTCDLFDGMYFPLKHPKNKISQTERLYVVCHINRAIVISHQNQLVDFDLKPENILLGADGKPRLSDFGMVYKVGDTIAKVLGSPGFISPEMIAMMVISDKKIIVETGNQMWSFGCLLADILKGRKFHYYLGQSEGNWLKVLNKEYLNSLINHCFPKHQDVGSIDWCIRRCLERDPEERISAFELQGHLDLLYQEQFQDSSKT